ncbi:hypothetical protein GCM10028801_30850 [Nocardioides maradonensis]
MAGENEKTFTENDMALLLADRVAKETADLTAERDSLKAERDDLATKLDVEIAAKVAAEQKVTEIQGEFDSFKSGLEELREAAERKDERLAKVKEAAAHMGEEFLKDEARVARIVAFSEEQFDGYVADLAATAPAAGASGGVPRESAMSGSQPAQPTSSARSLLLGRFAPKEA